MYLIWSREIAWFAMNFNIGSVWTDILKYFCLKAMESWVCWAVGTDSRQSLVARETNIIFHESSAF